MIKKSSIFFLLKCITVLFLPLFFLFISSDIKLWKIFWDFFQFIPHQNPPFSDFVAIQNAILSKKQGFDIYYLNPFDGSGHKFMYPSIWVDLFSFLQSNIKYFNSISIYLILFLYFFVIINFFQKFNNLFLKIILILFLFSTSNLLLLERLNIEIIIFCLVYFCIINNNVVYQFLFFNLSVIGKIFPLFSVLMFINDKRIFFLMLLSSAVIILFNFNEILLMRENMIEYALIIAYGTPSIARSFYHYSKTFDFFVNDNNYFFFRNILVISSFVYIFVIFSISYRFHKNKNNNFFSQEEKFLFSGAGIYLGTFVTSSNIDYRLIFLLFVIPYITKNLNNYFKYFFLFSFFISINSLIFEGGDRFNILYLLKAFLVIFSKIYIFSYLSFILGKIFKEKSLFKF
jgi:hypothetical protein